MSLYPGTGSGTVYPAPAPSPAPADISTWAQYPADHDVAVGSYNLTVGGSTTLGAVTSITETTGSLTLNNGVITSTIALAGSVEPGTITLGATLNPGGLTTGIVQASQINMAGSSPLAINNPDQINMNSGGALNGVATINGIPAIQAGSGETYVTNPMSADLNANSLNMAGVGKINGVVVPSDASGDYVITPMVENLDGNRYSITNCAGVSMRDSLRVGDPYNVIPPAVVLIPNTAGTGASVSLVNDINGIEVPTTIIPPYTNRFVTSPVQADVDCGNNQLTNVAFVNGVGGVFVDLNVVDTLTVGSATHVTIPVLTFTGASGVEGSITNLGTINTVPFSSLVRNPMISDLDCGGNALTNVSLVGGVSVNQIITSPSTIDLDMNGHRLTGVTSLTSGSVATSSLTGVISMAMTGGAITGVNTINGASYPPPVAGFVQNPMTTSLNANNKNITAVGNLTGVTGITTPVNSTTTIAGGNGYASVTLADTTPAVVTVTANSGLSTDTINLVSDVVNVSTELNVTGPIVSYSINTPDVTIPSGSGGLITFSDGTTQSTAYKGYVPACSFIGTNTSQTVNLEYLIFDSTGTSPTQLFNTTGVPFITWSSSTGGLILDTFTVSASGAYQIVLDIGYNVYVSSADGVLTDKLYSTVVELVTGAGIMPQQRLGNMVNVISYQVLSGQDTVRTYPTSSAVVSYLTAGTPYCFRAYTPYGAEATWYLNNITPKASFVKLG